MAERRGAWRRALLLALALAGGARAEEAAPLSAHDLARIAQNPLADTVMLPLANETNFGIGRERKTGNILNVQPVIPLRLGPDWNLITRVTVPVVAQPRLSPTEGSNVGIGNLVPIMAFSPAQSGAVAWGVGPTFLLPSATGRTLGTRNWAAGPAAIALLQPDPWTLGALFTHWWSFAGPAGERPVNRTAVQLFAIYNFADGGYLSYSPIITAEWARPSGQRWTLPVGLEYGRVFEWGGQAMSASAGAYYNALHPPGEASWQLRAGLTLIFTQ